MALESQYRRAIGFMKRQLDKAGIPFALSGSIALRLIGYKTRTSKDVDIYLGATADRLMFAFDRFDEMTCFPPVPTAPGQLRMLYKDSKEADSVEVDCLLSTYAVSPSVYFKLMLLLQSTWTISRRLCTREMVSLESQF